MARLLAAVLLVTALSAGTIAHCQAPAPAATGTLQGRIADPLGAAISRSFVLVYSERWGNATKQVSVNDNGEFQIPLEPGMYSLFISSRGFIPYAKAIKIVPGKPVVLKVKLQVDMEHLED
jgi:hypothetical protein